MTFHKHFHICRDKNKLFADASKWDSFHYLSFLTVVPSQVLKGGRNYTGMAVAEIKDCKKADFEAEQWKG